MGTDIENQSVFFGLDDDIRIYNSLVPTVALPSEEITFQRMESTMRGDGERTTVIVTRAETDQFSITDFSGLVQ